LKLKLTRRAERDLDETWVYVRERNPLAADELLDKIIDAIMDC